MVDEQVVSLGFGVTHAREVLRHVRGLELARFAIKIYGNMF
jgi:hypothetical protein